MSGSSHLQSQYLADGGRRIAVSLKSAWATECLSRNLDYRVRPCSRQKEAEARVRQSAAPKLVSTWHLLGEASLAHLEVIFFGKMKDHVSPLSSSVGSIKNLIEKKAAQKN